MARAERSGKQLERLGVAGPDDAEVTVVQGGDVPDAEALGHRDDARVHQAEGQVGVALDEGQGALPVSVGEVLTS